MLDKVLDWRKRETWKGGSIIIKSDQEPPVKRLVKDLVQARTEGKSVVEESPVGSSGCNGEVEKAVQAVEGQIRVILLALEATVAATEPIVTYIPDHAMYLIIVWKSGKTERQRTRVKGKVASVLGLEFGEKVVAKKRSKWDYPNTPPAQRVSIDAAR